MARYIFIPAAVTTNGSARPVTYWDRETNGRQITDIWRVNGSDQLTDPVPNGVLVAAAGSGLVGTFAGPDDRDVLWQSVQGGARLAVDADHASQADAAAGGGGEGGGAVASVAGKTGTVTLVKGDVGLDEVDNTADADKPISSAAVTALALKAPIASPTFTGTVSGVTKAHVGLGNVDNTTDANKPVSTAGQTALDLKANLASPTFSGTVSGISKSMVGLGSVDNTADTAKPVSTATTTALNLKANIASPTFTGTVAGITKSMVGLGNVDNTADASKTFSTTAITSGLLDIARAPAGTTVTVRKTTGGIWPGGDSDTGVRPTARTDITVIWVGEEPSPNIVSSGTAGMLDDVDERKIIV